MEQKSMTALISAFSRAYHSVQNKEKIFNDYLAKEFLTLQEYEQISSNMAKGIKFFNPSFEGTEEEALRFIVDNQLSPTPLGRAAFTEKSLENAVKIGAKQYLIFVAGYDTFAYRQPEWAKSIEIFELDHPLTGIDKKNRINEVISDIPSNVSYVSIDFTEKSWERKLMECDRFNGNKISFCSLLGISYYLTKEDFSEAIKIISSIFPKGSSIAFDYQDGDTYTTRASERVKKQVAMAGAAKEKMLAAYTYEEIEKLLADCDFLIYEHLKPEEITEQYFEKYNSANPKHIIKAFDNVNYCLAVKK